MVFCNLNIIHSTVKMSEVTILILIDGFLQSMCQMCSSLCRKSHNPYFNRWFSAIYFQFLLQDIIQCHNPYFNRWFSAIGIIWLIRKQNYRHNPYFNRWFSAMKILHLKKWLKRIVTILILIDGFLQYDDNHKRNLTWRCHNPYFNRWFSAITKWVQ